MSGDSSACDVFYGGDSSACDVFYGGGTEQGLCGTEPMLK
jgi:hypothetical protein